jgi:Na+-driven multidrug efflux pump
LALYDVRSATDELAQLTYSAAITRVFCMWPFYFLHALMTCGSDVLRGLGKSSLATISSLVGSCLLRIVWIYTAFRAFPRLSMIYVSYPITWGLTALALLAFVLYELRHLEEKNTKRAS